MREQFEEELLDVKNQVNQLAKNVLDQLDKSMDSLKFHNNQLALEIIEEDIKIDNLDLSINEQVVRLIAKQQPVATDLRHLIATIRITTDLERMADHAKNIARVTTKLKESESREVDPIIITMHELATEMLEKAIVAYKEEDITLAKELADKDDEMDKLYAKLLEEVVMYSTDSIEEREWMIQTTLCARFLERFGDYLTNISESITYMVKGYNIDLNK
ncbi:phosphate transport system protein [Pelagirhabdus alkalitolerans]|uniref:Phosphate-specific transport system accessory protein PhoU n=1 Tax=Pelagirhabdus alkalitolerans TaxID=1612202 RepID=A0A1G6HRW8_9BACI|nr:phosphate signaling complex protein PhoU [Pelagirhabdus alkalitolerans]SDB96893.1 phosphate transport system protein [Pelagirhabdus alkalitolerans]